MGLAYTIDKINLKQSYDKKFPKKKLFNLQSVRKEEEIDTYDASDLVLFPHVLTKNIVFEMNFGQRVSLIGDEPFAPIKADYFLIQKIPIAKRFCSDSTERDQQPEVNCNISNLECFLVS